MLSFKMRHECNGTIIHVSSANNANRTGAELVTAVVAVAVVVVVLAMAVVA
jgi:hypothetical protein